MKRQRSNPSEWNRKETVIRNNYEKNMERKNDYSLAKEQGKMPAQSNPASPIFDLVSILQILSFDIKEGHCFCWNERSGRRNNEVGTSATMDTVITS